MDNDHYYWESYEIYSADIHKKPMAKPPSMIYRRHVDCENYYIGIIWIIPYELVLSAFIMRETHLKAVRSSPDTLVNSQLYFSKYYRQFVSSKI